MGDRFGSMTVALFSLCVLAACAGGQAEVPPPVPETPSLAEVQRRRAMVELERRGAEQELARRAREAYGGDIPDYAVGRVLYATDRRASPMVRRT